MQVYTYSEARQKLAAVLDKAEASGSVMIRRKDGRTFTLQPLTTKRSPLDVPSIRTKISTDELVDLIRKERSRTRARKSHRGPGPRRPGRRRRRRRRGGRRI